MRAEEAPLTRLQRMVLTLASFVLIATSMMALGPLLSGSGWWWLCAFVGAGVLFAGAGLRVVRLPAALVPIGELVALLLLLTLLFGGTTSLVLVVPTPATFGVFGDLLAGAQRTIAQQSTPAVVVPALSFVLALDAGLLAVVVDMLVQTFRVPAFAAGPALAPVVITGILLPSGSSAPTLVLIAAAFLLLLRVDVRVHRSAVLDDTSLGDQAPEVTPPGRVPVASTLGVTAGLAAAGLIVASALTAATPSLSAGQLFFGGTPGAMFSSGVSPFIELGRDLRRTEPVPAFHYTGGDGERPYFRLFTVDRFTGSTWTADQPVVDADHTVASMPEPEGLSPEVATSTHRFQVTVDALQTTWLPLPYPSSAVSGLRGSWFWDSSTLAVRSVDADTGAQQYTVARTRVEPTPEQLREAPPAPDSLSRYLTLPAATPRLIVDTAQTVAGRATNAYDKAMAIQDYLRGIDFRYSTEAPAKGGYDGSSLAVVAKFLEQKEGYCVHFASAMAVLARVVGIPARVAVGYAPGTPVSDHVGGGAQVDVTSADLHAWPELFFSGVGWVAFEPTPGRGTVPVYARDDAAQQPGTPVSTRPSASPSSKNHKDGDPGGGMSNAAGASAADSWPVRAVGLIVVVVLALLVPAGIRMLQRSRRRHRMARGPDGAGAAWTEVLASARDLGVPGLSALTPRTVAAELAVRPAFADPGAADALTVLRDAVELERYGPPASSVRLLDEALDRVRAALAADAPPLDRVRARLAPASLADGVRGLVRRAPA